MSTEDHKAVVLGYWWSKAEASLASAQRELGVGALEFAMNRVYYAAFYAVSAALLQRQASFKKHTGVRAAFHREFVKTGLLESTWGKFYDQLFEDRQEGDYIALVEFEREYVEMQLSRCRAFLNQLRPLIPSLTAR